MKQVRQLYLPVRYRRQIDQMVRIYLPQAEIWAYGSRVRGTHAEASDLDLVVRNRFNVSQPTPAVRLLRRALAESTLPIRVQVSDWALLPAHFRAEIATNPTYRLPFVRPVVGRRRRPAKLGLDKQ